MDVSPSPTTSAPADESGRIARRWHSHGRRLGHDAFTPLRGGRSASPGAHALGRGRHASRRVAGPRDAGSPGGGLARPWMSPSLAGRWLLARHPEGFIHVPTPRPPREQWREQFVCSRTCLPARCRSRERPSVTDVPSRMAFLLRLRLLPVPMTERWARTDCCRRSRRNIAMRSWPGKLPVVGACRTPPGIDL